MASARPLTSAGPALTEHDAGVAATSDGHVTPMPVISRDRPAFANHASYPAALAFDADYATVWRSGHVPTDDAPNWLAIDLSGVPLVERSTVYSVWFNEAGYNYDTADGHGYTLPGDYEIQSNVAGGGGQPPAAGWVTLVSQKRNTLSSGAHLLHLEGANWLRFVCTAPASTDEVMNFDTALEWDIHDAHASLDAWKFIGDSITANAMGHQKTNDSFNQLVNAQVPNYPAFEMAGHGFWKSSTALEAIDRYLANFPGRYVGLSLGTNDGDPTTYRAAMNGLIEKVLAASKIPVLPTIPYTGEPGHALTTGKLNAAIESLYATYGKRLVRGPDLYATLFAGRSTMFDKPDDLHPNAAGNAAIRRAWADAMVKSVYH